MWQDYVLTAGTLFFTATLVPMAVDRRTAVPRYKSAPTSFWLVAFAVVQYSLGLRLGPVCELTCAACWAWIATKRAPPRGRIIQGWNPKRPKTAR